MKRATVTIGDELNGSLNAWMSQHEVTPAFTAVVQAALREYLARRGFAPGGDFRVTPAPRGSGYRDTSARHDDYLAGK